MMERLQKLISQAGVCSRRKAEELIAAGRVTVNGTAVTELGSKADSERQDGPRMDGGGCLAGPRVLLVAGADYRAVGGLDGSLGVPEPGRPALP